MPKKPSSYYVSNKELLAEVIAYKKSLKKDEER